MTLKQTIWISLATVFFVIGVHQIFISSANDISGKIFDGYWAIMLSSFCFLAYVFLKKKKKELQITETPESSDKKNIRPKNKRRKKRKK